MSDAVMVPRAEMKFAIAKAIWEIDRNESTAARTLMVAAQNLLTAASPSVGGWEEPVAQPSVADIVAVFRANLFACHEHDDRTLPIEIVNWGDAERELLALYAAPPPPSVSIDDGSRPQEAVPTEQAEPAFVEPCYECGSTERVGTACKPCNPEINNLSFGFSDGYRERLFQMIVDCEANPECDLMLSSSVAAEHAADLRAALSELRPQPADGCSSNEGEA